MSYPIKDPSSIFESIFQTVSNGATLTESVRQTDVSLAWVKRKIQHDPDLQRAYQIAVVERAGALADEIVALSDSKPPPELQGAELSAWVGQLKLRLWARTWIASKLAPKQWGDRLDVSVKAERISITAALQAAEARVRDERLRISSTG